MDHVREMVDWTRRRKIVVAGLVAANADCRHPDPDGDIGLGCPMKALSFAERMHPLLALPDPFRRPVQFTRLSRG